LLGRSVSSSRIAPTPARDVSQRGSCLLRAARTRSP
jgi:hypothetical protein